MEESASVQGKGSLAWPVNGLRALTQAPLPTKGPVQRAAVLEGQEPARAGSNSGKKAARFLPGVLRAGPGSAAKRLTHSWNNFSSIWKEHMLFLLGEARVWRSFAETCRKRQTLAWLQHPDFQPHAVCRVAEPVGLCSQVQGEKKAQGVLVGTSVLGHGASLARGWMSSSHFSCSALQG